MASNVKITVQEINQTAPRGAGASADVVYVPGLVIYDGDGFESTKNEPVLCQDIATFRRHFGDRPYEFQTSDFQDANGDSVYEDIKNAHKVDPSYVYASELIRAGLPVYYEAIVPDGSTTTAEISTALAALNIAKSAYEAAQASVTESKAAYDAAASAYAADNSDENGRAAYEASIVYESAKEALATATSTYNQAQQTYEDAVNQATSRLHYFMVTVKERIAALTDKGEYTGKYITTGGYPSVTIGTDGVGVDIATTMLSVANERQDAVALLDHTDIRTIKLGVGVEDSLYDKLNDALKTISHSEFGAMFTPWALYNCGNTLSDVVGTKDVNESQVYLPASFGYLMCLAKAIKTSPNWLAMAGVTRGMVPNLVSLAPNERLNNNIAEDYQPKFGDNENNKISINAITNIKPYGYCIWGNRTLYPVDPKGTTALNFLNTRNMISDIKKLAYTTAKSLMFEQDSNILWLKFKSGVSPLLDRLVGGYGIKEYKIIKGDTKADGTALTRGEIAATIRIYPLYANEYFEITVIIADDDVKVS